MMIARLRLNEMVMFSFHVDEILIINLETKYILLFSC